MSRALAVLMCLLPLAACGQQADKPWEAWQPAAQVVPTPNGFDLYQAAFDLKEEIDREQGLGEGQAAPPPGVPPDPWGEGPAELAVPQRVLLYQPVLTLVRQALTQDCRFPQITSVAEPLPYLRSVRSVARLLAMEAECHRLERDGRAAAASALDGLAMAQDAMTQGIIISWLVGVATEAISLNSLELTVPMLDAAQCKQTAGELRALQASRPPASQWLAGEETFARLGLRELATRPTLLRDLVEDDKDIATDEKCRRLVAEQLPLAWEAITPYYQQLAAALAQPYRGDRSPAPLPANPLLTRLTPRWQPVWFRTTHSDLRFTLLEAELSASAYLLDQGRLPQSLADLVPTYLPQVPTDPFDGKPLKSVVTGGSLVIYSVGPDGIDDGGKPTDPANPSYDAKGDIRAKVR